MRRAPCSPTTCMSMMTASIAAGVIPPAGAPLALRDARFSTPHSVSLQVGPACRPTLAFAPLCGSWRSSRARTCMLLCRLCAAARRPRTRSLQPRKLDACGFRHPNLHLRRWDQRDDSRWHRASVRIMALISRPAHALLIVASALARRLRTRSMLPRELDARGSTPPRADCCARSLITCCTTHRPLRPTARWPLCGLAPAHALLASV